MGSTSIRDVHNLFDVVAQTSLDECQRLHRTGVTEDIDNPTLPETSTSFEGSKVVNDSELRRVS